MITFTFNGIDFSNDIRINEITGRGLTPSQVTTVEVPGMAGSHAGRKKRISRSITVKFTVVGSSLTDLRNKINTLSERLDLDEVAPLVFSDEPDKEYYAIMIDGSDEEEIKTYGMGTFTFLCPDPYKYGPEMTATLSPTTGSIINVGGTAPSKPVFTLTATAPETFAMVANSEGEYNMIGAPVDVSTETFQKYTISYSHEMQNVTNWVVPAAGEVDHPIAGQMVSLLDSQDGLYKFKATDFEGTGDYPNTYHGPALKRSLPAPLQDFRAWTHVKLRNRTSEEQIGNIEVYLLDVNGKIIARIGLRDGSSKYQNVHAQARLGGALGTEGVERQTLVISQGDKPGAFNDFDGVMRIVREGRKWSVYFAKVHPDGWHHTRLSETWTDTHDRFQEPITQVVVAMQTYGYHPGAQMAFISMKIEQINQQVGVPYIAAIGDEVVLDHTGRGSYSINGEDAKKFKNFGATQFLLKPGSNTLQMQPEGTFTGTVKWRNAYK